MTPPALFACSTCSQITLLLFLSLPLPRPACLQAIWKTLACAQNNFGEKTLTKPINPKSVTRNELYGSLHPSTREWREGLMSVTFRDYANNTTNRHQWIVLDGDIDAEWIESMNTVMDDNKMLTLASNERIPLTASMKLLLEINHMVHCSPATVSRGGVIYVNAEVRVFAIVGNEAEGGLCQAVACHASVGQALAHKTQECCGCENDA